MSQRKTRVITMAIGALAALLALGGCSEHRGGYYRDGYYTYDYPGYYSYDYPGWYGRPDFDGHHYFRHDHERHDFDRHEMGHEHGEHEFGHGGHEGHGGGHGHR